MRAVAVLALLLASCACPKKPAQNVGTPAPKPTGRVVCDGDSCRFVPDAPKVAPTNEGVTEAPFAPAESKPPRRELDPVVPRAPTRLSSAKVIDPPPAPMDEAPEIDSGPPAPTSVGTPPKDRETVSLGGRGGSDSCGRKPTPWYCSATFAFCAFLVAVLVVAALIIRNFNRRS